MSKSRLEHVKYAHKHAADLPKEMWQKGIIPFSILGWAAYLFDFLILYIQSVHIEREGHNTVQYNFQAQDPLKIYTPTDTNEVQAARRYTAPSVRSWDGVLGDRRQPLWEQLRADGRYGEPQGNKKSDRHGMHLI